MSRTIIDALFAYFDACPLISGGRLNIDYLPENTSQAGVEYSIAASPVRRADYSLPERRRPLPVPLCDQQCQRLWPGCGPESFEHPASLTSWPNGCGKRTGSAVCPALPEGMSARSIRAVGAGYLYQPDLNAGKYQIQCELEYYRRSV